MVVALIYGSDCPWPFLIEINDPSQVVPTDILLMKAVKSILVQLKLGEQRTVLGIRPARSPHRENLQKGAGEEPPAGEKSNLGEQTDAICCPPHLCLTDHRSGSQQWGAGIATTRPGIPLS